MHPSLVCVDAGVALKLVVSEPDSTLARALWDAWRGEHITPIAPFLWAYEVTSVIRNQTRRGLLPSEEEATLIDTLHMLPVQLPNPPGLPRHAWEIARQFNHPTAYDAHYLALAQMEGCAFWTADRRLFTSVHTTFPWVYWLGNYQG